MRVEASRFQIAGNAQAGVTANQRELRLLQQLVALAILVDGIDQLIGQIDEQRFERVAVCARHGQVLEGPRLARQDVGTVHLFDEPGALVGLDDRHLVRVVVERIAPRHPIDVEQIL